MQGLAACRRMGHEVSPHATRPMSPDHGPRTTHTYDGMGSPQGPAAPNWRSSSRGRQEHVQVQVQLQAPLHEVLLLLQAPLPQLLRQVLLQVQLQAPLHEVLAPAEPG